MISRNNLWSHNDSGGEPELYTFDTLGNLLKVLKISNASNHDWEDLAQDSAGNFYVGDFGNNTNDRTNLRIYKIPSPTTIAGSYVTATKINFTYPDQQDFPPADSLKNFDMEAMIAFRNNLYLFSKNRTNPYTGYTHLYRLPDVAGTYTAELLDSFYTGGAPEFTSNITSADISPDGSKLVLLNATGCWLFTDFAGDNFFQATARHFQFNIFSQFEAICFINNSELYLTDEYGTGLGQKLYYVNLAPYLSNTTSVNYENRNSHFQFRTISGNAEWQFKSANTSIVRIDLYNSAGQLLNHVTQLLNSNEWTAINFSSYLSSGIYLLHISDTLGNSQSNRVVLIGQ